MSSVSMGSNSSTAAAFNEAAFESANFASLDLS
jgi:hypothetical protein